MNKLPISVIILTFNEEVNIRNCLESLKAWAGEIFIVDSFSTDRTLEISRAYTDKIFSHSFENQAKQFNWALENLPINSQWVMRLDADEKVTPELAAELSDKLVGLESGISGLRMKRKVFFMGRWIKHGGYYPQWLLRVWRKEKARYEERWMDEHVKIKEGSILSLENDIIDDNNKSLHWWIGKHNAYATREAVDILDLKYNFSGNDFLGGALFKSQEQEKRWLKERVYLHMPLFLRAFFYFIYRYLFRFGFLDGREGLIWHFLQGFWYRFLIDAKIYEIYKKAGRGKDNIKKFIENNYSVKLAAKG
ncbi:MAG: glycosyltransferase family 2 protein [Candidatus Omnitrophica bacterium]|nr:glycosyltransferase family 2 protein [Candidatus Omnitrophota bacterium]MDD5652836.1 glycosyltransferase family 2 protein [Candidatus Omnitrophota bacterium]